MRIAAAAAVALCLATGAAVAQELGKYSVDMDEITVSGISAGGFMAVQLHVAYSTLFRGAGSIAGGAYFCAQDSMTSALTACMTTPSMVNVGQLQDQAEEYERGGDIDSLSNLAKSRVYIFAGTQDKTVDPDESRKLEDFYAKYVNGTDSTDGQPRVYTEYSIAAGHSHVTDDYGNACNREASPYINNCNYDQSGILLQHLYFNQLKPPGAYIEDNLLRFGQTGEFDATSLDATGFVYVPTACQSGSTCKLHVALHGCVQNWDTIDLQYVEHAGYNEWAETNNIIILYPQAEPNLVLSNPNACFDWWGYAGSDYATKTGTQMQAIYEMVQHLASGAPPLLPPTNLVVTNATDNTVSLEWQASPDATTYEVLRDSVRVTVPGGIPEMSFTDTGLATGTRYHYVVIALNDQGGASAKSNEVSVTTTGPPPPLSAPVGLSAPRVEAYEVFLVWTDVNSAEYYEVVRDGLELVNVTVANFHDTGLEAETTYTYYVLAGNPAGISPSSQPLTVTTTSTWQCNEFRDNNYNHVADNRAYQQAGIAYALGSDDYMGLWNVAVITNLAETSEGYFIVGNC